MMRVRRGCLALRNGLIWMLLMGILAGLLPLSARAEEFVDLAEAEEGTLLGHAKAAGGAVSSIERDGDGVSVVLTVPQSGHYDIVVRQAAVGGGSKINTVLANGQNVGDLACSSASWNDGVVEYVWLEAGENTIAVLKSWGWIKVDYIALRLSAPIPEDVYDVEPVLANPNANEAARRVMTFLCDNYGKKVISGQQSQEGPFGLPNAAVWRGTGGSYPAILGMDFLNLCPARVAKGDTSNVIEYAIEYWEKGGLITFSWHWCPDGSYDNGKNDWGTFYTENTRFNLAKVMSGQDDYGYRMLLRDIDAIAGHLKQLQDAGVPILWRPLHEASGGWFWWGASGPEAYLKLYKLLFQRLTYYHGLNNLIWVWNGQDAAWYPGDEYVDVIGEDIYPGERVYTSQAARFLKALSYTEGRKLIALTENGCIPDPDQLIRDRVMWAWWCTWDGEFVLKTAGFNAYSEKYTEKAMLKKAYKHDSVITRKTLPDLKAYPLRDEQGLDGE